MKSKWIALSGLSFSIGFCLSIPINKNIEKSLLMGVGASASTMASVSILSKLNKIDEHIYRSRLDLTEQQKDVAAQLEHLQEDKASAGESLAVVVEQLDKKNEAYSQISDRNKQLESDKEDLESLINQYSSELDDISCLIEERNEEIDQLDQSKSDLESTLKDLHGQQTSFEQRLEENRSSLSLIEAEVSSLEEQRVGLLANCETLNEEIKSIEQNKTEINASISNAELQLSQNNAEEKSLQERIIALSSQAEAKETEVSKLNIEISKLNKNKEIIEDKKNSFSSLDFIYLSNTGLDNRQQKIKEICEDKDIDICTHFTRIKNLPSILTHGLLPRKHLKKLNINYESVNPERVDSYNDSVSLNISFPHYDLVFDYTERTQKNWVCISYAKNILWELDCAFYFTESTSKKILSTSLEERKSVKSFEELFIGNDHLPKEYPTDSKAEVLVFGVIPPSYLKTVTFYDDEVRDNWMRDNPIFSFNDRLFSRRDKIRSGCESAKEVNIHH
ncbi:DarT ssDNA thymidine ADP-ribosyltransferase family protein [Acaryochloris sp. CCMEE 5410]|uniref:DarT ssDNA thymidine ADP-ribosyltransferase family protein n=1 Tax=Acaryochloris sp. CCMEE 5410 TaxID=310037 RepID=UPI0002483963|nr:DarT ssDNA thymidine ADP-ribosyltransferase family protein [Acaryochloris sp. CCMEE 5410]KAI9132203.1 DUF4433 domain-containing protein [Acaryochloris sp. CCMEE 5410]